MTEELTQAVETGSLDKKTAEKLDLLAPGTFCTHKSWGFGRVAEWNLPGGQILIDFKTRKNHPMQTAYAVETLTPLAPEHILARANNDPEGVRAAASSDAVGLVRSILADLGGKATADQIAAALAPAMDATAFKRWWDPARKKMKADGHFKIPVKKTDPCVLLDAPVDSGTGIIAAFAEARHPKDQLLALDRICKSLSELAGKNAEVAALLGQIGEAAQRLSRLNPAQAIELLAARDEIAGRFPALKEQAASPAIAEILTAESSRLSEIFSAIPGARQREVLEAFDAAFPENWQDKALRLVRDGAGRLIADVCRLFERRGEKERFQSAVQRWISERATSSELLIWLCKERDKRFPALFNAELLAAVFSALEADLLAEKRTSRLKDLLIDDHELIGDLLAGAERDVVRDTMRKLLLTPAIEDLSKRSLMARIVKLYPETQAMITGVAAEQDGEASETLIVSWPSLEKRKADLDHLITREIPQNLRDINIAKEQGDLRENAGFKAAKEHQRVLQRRKVEMERDLALARGTSFETPNTEQVSIGTVVTIRNPDGTSETFSILGAWDSAPELGIVSYKAGLGQSLLGTAAGQSVELPSEHGTRQAVVESIAPFTDHSILAEKIHVLKGEPQPA
jgi:transcription elongation GreA/GreB family factor